MNLHTPLIINLAPTGMLPTRSQSPYVPLTPQEIIENVRSCFALGVSMVHLHARDQDHHASNDVKLYADIIEGIRYHCPSIVIVTTTSGRNTQDITQRASSLMLQGASRPDMASLTLGSMNFASTASINSPADITQLARIMHEQGIKPELEIFDLGMVNFAKILIDKGLLSPPFYFNIILGNPATAQLKLAHLASIVADLPEQSIWSVGGIGRYQTAANALGITMGHGVRTGLEDNLWYDNQRTQLASNQQFVTRIVSLARTLDRAIATPNDTRALLGL
ncbi:3-keto-5-aminohexanoate cleavage protein [Undibacterium sp. Di24W]